MQTFKKIVKGTLMFIGLLFVVITLIIVIGGKKQANDFDYSDAITSQESKTEFMSTCAEDPSFYEYCSCAYEDLESKYGVSGITKMGLEYELDGELSDKMIESAIACVDYLY